MPDIVHSINTMPMSDALFTLLVVSLVTGYFCLVTWTNSRQQKQKSPRLTHQLVTFDVPKSELHPIEQTQLHQLQFHQPSTDSTKNSSSEVNADEEFKNFGTRKTTTSLSAELYGKKYGLAAIFAAFIIRVPLSLRIGNEVSFLAIPNTAHYVMGVIVGVSWILGLFIRDKRFLDKFVTFVLIVWAAMLLF